MKTFIASAIIVMTEYSMYLSLRDIHKDPKWLVLLMVLVYTYNIWNAIRFIKEED